MTLCDTFDTKKILCVDTCKYDTYRYIVCTYLYLYVYIYIYNGRKQVGLFAKKRHSCWVLKRYQNTTSLRNHAVLQQISCIHVSWYGRPRNATIPLYPVTNQARIIPGAKQDLSWRNNERICFAPSQLLTWSHGGLVILYGLTGLDQYCFRWWLVVGRHQAIIAIDADLLAI